MQKEEIKMTNLLNLWGIHNLAEFCDFTGDVDECILWLSLPLLVPPALLIWSFE